MTNISNKEIVWNFLKKLKVKLTYDPKISFLTIDTKILNYYLNEIYALLFIAVLFTIVKTQLQPKFLMTDEKDTENIVYTHTYICIASYLHMKVRKFCN